ncbi:BhlA/UviB family holin-like peptide [Tumebacillus algifaecis]|uniref:BhlA/UviB family holin-like peptide n=1 Tax=Tumebacillus algifaecis TaxID=1214604 RepID=UPI0012FE26A4|nr:BhlA/UviB family holin-like peptide [Tumebacillus algifaecis]
MEILTFFQGQGPWALLFVWMLWKTKQESKEREDRLMAHNEGYQTALSELSAGQQQIVTAIAEMRADIDDLKDELKKEDLEVKLK